MAPPPEYDKEPKAPDKSATSILNEDSKANNLLFDVQINSDHKPVNSASNSEVENNKHVETLDDGQLRALLDEAIQYKCPKDREGKSSLFQELLEEVEQDEACEAARSFGPRGVVRDARGRLALSHANSMQDLVAALAGESPQRPIRHQPPQRAHASVSERATHGGSLPSGVDTSFHAAEEPVSGGGYLATVRCVNPPPLAERRVSASDANCPAELELLNKRSKTTFPMYTARATLEIGSGSVCSGRAVTTTTASNQVRTAPAPPPPPPPPQPPPPPRSHNTRFHGPHGPKTPERGDPNQIKLLTALRSNTCGDESCEGGGYDDGHNSDRDVAISKSRGPKKTFPEAKNLNLKSVDLKHANVPSKNKSYDNKLFSELFEQRVDSWYKGLTKAFEEPSFSNISKNHRREAQQMCSNRMYRYSDIYPNIRGPNISLGPEKYLSSECNSFNNTFTLKPNNRNQKQLKGNKDASVLQHSNNSNKKYIIQRIQNIQNVLKTIDQDKVDKINDSIKYRQHVGKLEHHSLTSFNPKNVRKMTVAKPTNSDDMSYLYKPVEIAQLNRDIKYITKETGNTKIEKSKEINSNVNLFQKLPSYSEVCMHTNANYEDVPENDNNNNVELIDLSNVRKVDNMIDGDLTDIPHKPYILSENMNTKKMDQNLTLSCNDNIELLDMTKSQRNEESSSNSFSKYLAAQQKLFEVLENANVDTLKDEIDYQEDTECVNTLCSDVTVQKSDKSKDMLTKRNTNSYVFLTFPKRLLTEKHGDSSVQIHEINNNSDKSNIPDANSTIGYHKAKKEKVVLHDSNSKKNKDFYKTANKFLLFDDLLKRNKEKPVLSRPGHHSKAVKEVDSAIPFSCITTPEVVASCNTTSSTSQSAVATDPKPLQLSSCYRAVGAPPTPAPAPAPAPASASDSASASAAASASTTTVARRDQSRSVIGYNGLAGSRQHGFIVASAPEEHKKSLDENGNAVQGISSPSLHKKPRRKKSSKNETVINLQKIDGYQGNKDLNELLRFIESNADNGRGSKLSRTKHKDDSDDKGGKKRSNERRKEKESKMKRATSMEELSRTKLEDLTVEAESPLRSDKKERRSDVAPAKAERRSWGDDSRDSFYYRPAEPEPAPEVTAAAAELTEFQTVTKRRKPRRRTDEHERDDALAPRRPRPPSPAPRARRESAPPSDRSNDSNDDMDSVHSLPAAPPPAPAPVPPHASYADIARTRHNIPDLIESCNFYAEGGDAAAERRRAEPPAAPGDADGYPALEPRPAAAPGGPPRARTAKPPPPAAPRRDRKERAAEPVAECPAPDVVADRRPPVILLDSAARPRDMDGVTFGFDINEQLLGTAARRPRCDLVRDAPDGEPPGAGAGSGAGPAGGPSRAVPVRAGCAALRYVPPEPPPDVHHLHQIIDYVGSAWEDVIRCGGGKVRYFSE